MHHCSADSFVPIFFSGTDGLYIGCFRGYINIYKADGIRIASFYPILDKNQVRFRSRASLRDALFWEKIQQNHPVKQTCFQPH